MLAEKERRGGLKKLFAAKPRGAKDQVEGEGLREKAEQKTAKAGIIGRLSRMKKWVVKKISPLRRRRSNPIDSGGESNPIEEIQATPREFPISSVSMTRNVTEPTERSREGQPQAASIPDERLVQARERNYAHLRDIWGTDLDKFHPWIGMPTSSGRYPGFDPVGAAQRRADIMEARAKITMETILEEDEDEEEETQKVNEEPNEDQPSAM